MGVGLRAIFVIVSLLCGCLTWAENNAANDEADPCALKSDLASELARVFSPELLAKITRIRESATPTVKPPRILEPIAPAKYSNAEILAELKSVTGAPFLSRNGFSIYIAKGKQIPKALDELGRLREETFRPAGEGTGKSRDLDPTYDPHYFHLIAWDEKEQSIAASYRLAIAKDVLAERGPKGLYLLEQFNVEKPVYDNVFPYMLELSRSFVRPERQKSFALFVMLKAITKFMAQHKLRYLGGAASISDDLDDNAKAVMTQFLRTRHLHPQHENVTPVLTPQFHPALTVQEIQMLVDGTESLGQLEKLVRFLNSKKIVNYPELIPIYIGVGVRFLGFNYDPSFNTVDGFILTDVPMLEERIRKRYMEKEDEGPYMQYWGPHLRK